MLEEPELPELTPEEIPEGAILLSPTTAPIIYSLNEETGQVETRPLKVLGMMGDCKVCVNPD